MVNVQVLLPKGGLGKEVADEVAFYGFRPTLPTVFFLSAWEFGQWILPERLRLPEKADPGMGVQSNIFKLANRTVSPENSACSNLCAGGSYREFFDSRLLDFQVRCRGQLPPIF